MSSVAITEFTDPACPFAFSAEPHRLRLRWLFGDQLTWDVRMVGLSESREANAEKGLTPEMIAQGGKMLGDRYGMPIYAGVREAVPASIPACRAVVAARLHAPELEAALLRRLRHRAMAGEMLDDQAMIDGAAADVGIDPADLATWVTGDDVAEALAEDMRLSRTPTDAALALKQKLAKAGDGWRYTCPSYEIANGLQLSVPGMQSSLNYETALANVAPDLERRPEPEDVTEVLQWAGFPLATQEVAEVCGISRDEARERLVTAGAHEEPVGADGFWTITLTA